jgi:DNA-binding response OmpR family regulator
MEETTVMCNILLLEDEALIAIEVERMLADAQLGLATCLASCAEALTWLETNTPDVAVVDIFLKDGECDEVAEVLVARGVPLIIHTARRKATSDNHRVFRKGIWICKPSDPSELTSAVKACLVGHRCATFQLPADNTYGFNTVHSKLLGQTRSGTYLAVETSRRFPKL